MGLSIEVYQRPFQSFC